MTPEVLGYVKLDKGWAELSEGLGFNGQPIFGVTVRGHAGERLDPDPSQLCDSRAHAEAYSRSLMQPQQQP